MYYPSNLPFHRNGITATAMTSFMLATIPTRGGGSEKVAKVHNRNMTVLSLALLLVNALLPESYQKYLLHNYQMSGTYRACNNLCHYTCMEGLRM